jgi:hypothetical protein
MSIFGDLKNAIFGAKSRPPPGAPPQTPAEASPTGATPGGIRAAAPPTGAKPTSQVDIAAVLSAKAASKPEKLNWQSSIVDLMKLVDLDPSLENRKALASELGYTGDTKDSANMNVWLHHQVMEELAAAGGKVPDDLRRH